jgi:hypothetical protein
MLLSLVAHRLPLHEPAAFSQSSLNRLDNFARECNTAEDFPPALKRRKSEEYSHIIVSVPQRRRIPLQIRCQNCGEFFTKDKNNFDACIWHETKHVGMLIVDRDADIWHRWDVSVMGSPDSEICQRKFSGDGGYIWSGCGCRSSESLCEHIGRHKTASESGQ